MYPVSSLPSTEIGIGYPKASLRPTQPVTDPTGGIDAIDASIERMIEAAKPKTTVHGVLAVFDNRGNPTGDVKLTCTTYDREGRSNTLAEAIEQYASARRREIARLKASVAIVEAQLQAAIDLAEPDEDEDEDPEADEIEALAELAAMRSEWESDIYRS